MAKKILNNLPEHMRDGINLNVIVDAIITQFDSFELNQSRLKPQIDISTATGIYLDDLGLIFNLTRNSGESDDNFRSRILAFWNVFIGSGTKGDLANAIASLLGLNIVDVTIEEPAKLIIQANIAIDENLDVATLTLVDGVIDNSKAAGVLRRKIKLNSRGGIFLLNFSEVNGADTIL